MALALSILIFILLCSHRNPLETMYNQCLSPLLI